MNAVYSWTRLFARTASAALGNEGRPTKLMYVVTKRCYSRCVYCDIWKAKDKPGGLDGELTLDEIRATAAANPFFQWIDFTGGEPTDRPDFVEVVRAFSDASPDLLLVHFPTNGIATRRIVDIVAALKSFLKARLVVTVSIDGPPEINDRLRGIRNDFAHAIETFIGLRGLLGPHDVYAGMTLHAHRGSSGRSSREFVEDTFAAINAALVKRGSEGIGWGSLHLNIPHFSSHYYGNEASRQDDGFGGPEHRREIAEALEFAAAQPKTGDSLPMRAIEKIYRAEAGRYLATGRTRIPCSALLSTAYLSEKGQVYPCTIWDKPLGNIREHAYRLMPIVEQARRDGVRRDVAAGRCPNCWTPCEAYPAIAASPLRSALSLLEASPHVSPPPAPPPPLPVPLSSSLQPRS